MIKQLSFILGFFSILSQIILLRELITVFYGNETAYAIILASWLFWIAVGSYSFSFLSRKVKNPSHFVTTLLYLISFFLPLTILATRSIKWIMHIQTGEIIGIIPMCLASFLLLAPLTFLLGCLFAAICHLWEMGNDESGSTKGISTIYLFESLGATFGGLLFSIVLVNIFDSMHMVFVISTISISILLFIHKKETMIFKSAVVLIIFFMIALSSGLINKFDKFTRSIQWQDYEIITIKDSIYGNITLTKRGSHYSFFENGLHSATTGDQLSSEESVHFPLLEHPNPQRVLLIGNGLTGSLEEILKHPVEEVDYIELDPKLTEVAKNYLPAKYLNPLKDKRVSVIHSDARQLIKRTDKKYHAIIVNLSDPTTALINRYYTLEFFKESQRILSSTGILALSVSSSENYLSDETLSYLRSINTTLNHVFKDVISIPGDTNIFLACNQKDVLTPDANVLIKRLKDRRIETKFVREYYLPFRLSADRILSINQALEERGALNTDTHPITYLYNIILWSTHFNTTYKNLIQNIYWIQPWQLMLLPIPIFLGGWLLGRKKASTPISLSILTTGFSEMVFQVIVILAFQALYGYAYYKIGLIMASFMCGLVLGTLTARRIMARSQASILKAYKTAQLGICFYPLLLPVAFIIFRDMAGTQRLVGVFASTFAVLPVIAGFIGGLQYPLAVNLRHSMEKRKKDRVVKAAGTLYALDVLGASIGALVTGAILIPLLGINAVALFCAALNGAVFLLLLCMPSYPARSSEVV